MQEYDIQRVKNVIDWVIVNKGIKSQRELADKIGYTESALSQILNERVDLSKRFIMTLSSIDDRINLNWLLTGEGEMILPSEGSFSDDEEFFSMSDADKDKNTDNTLEVRLNSLSSYGRLKFAAHFIVGLGIEESMKSLGISIGYSNNSAFSQVINGKVPLPRNTLAKFCQRYRFFSENWLANGEGGPFIGQKTTNPGSVDNNALTANMIVFFQKELEKANERTDKMMSLATKIVDKFNVE